MKHILLTAILAAVTLLQPPAPRCRFDRDGRMVWRVCPCRGVTYQCEDWRPLGTQLPRPWITVTR